MTLCFLLFLWFLLRSWWLLIWIYFYVFSFSSFFCSFLFLLVVWCWCWGWSLFPCYRSSFCFLQAGVALNGCAGLSCCPAGSGRHLVWGLICHLAGCWSFLLAVGSNCLLARGERCHLVGIESCHLAGVESCHLAGVESCHLAGVESCHLAGVESCHLAGVESCHLAGGESCWRSCLQPHWRAYCHQARDCGAVWATHHSQSHDIGEGVGATRLRTVKQFEPLTIANPMTLGKV